MKSSPKLYKTMAHLGFTFPMKDVSLVCRKALQMINNAKLLCLN